MAKKVWVLETQTKGTGANVVPLERVLKKGSDAVPGFKLPGRKARAPEEPAPRQPYAFKVVDLMTREVLGEDLDTGATIELLRDIRSVVDVMVYVWVPEGERWRRLTFRETRALWDYRGRADQAAETGTA
jgi:hypothetical protein